MKKLAKKVRREPAGSSEAENVQKTTHVSRMSWVHSADPVNLEPDVTLEAWALMQVISPSGERSRHLVGWKKSSMRVSTAVVGFDIRGMVAITESGRTYHLSGVHAQDNRTLGVYQEWLLTNHRAHHRDMTRALLRLASIRGENSNQRGRDMASF
jgi:hypothetical protein